MWRHLRCHACCPWTMPTGCCSTTSGPLAGKTLCLLAGAHAHEPDSRAAHIASPCLRHDELPRTKHARTVHSQPAVRPSTMMLCYCAADTTWWSSALAQGASSAPRGPQVSAHAWRSWSSTSSAATASTWAACRPRPSSAARAPLMRFVVEAAQWWTECLHHDASQAAGKFPRFCRMMHLAGGQTNCAISKFLTSKVFP